MAKKMAHKRGLARFLFAHLLKICFIISITDLLHALYFAIQAIILLITSLNIYSIIALLGSVFWVLIVIVLIVGLWKRRTVFVKAWLLFSLVGFITDILFLLWGIVTSVSVDWDRLNEFSIIFIGIFIEMLCIYLVYKYYLVMDPCRMVDKTKSTKKKKVKQKKLNAKACKASKKGDKKKKSPKKSAKKSPKKKKAKK